MELSTHHPFETPKEAVVRRWCGLGHCAAKGVPTASCKVHGCRFDQTVCPMSYTLNQDWCSACSPCKDQFELVGKIISELLAVL